VLPAAQRLVARLRRLDEVLPRYQVSVSHAAGGVESARIVMPFEEFEGDVNCG
jgi:hypothetical protein